MLRKYELFYTPACPKCPEIKEFVSATVKIDGELVDASTNEGLELAKQHNVMQAPTVLFFDEHSKVVCRAHTKEDIEKCLSQSQEL